MPEIKDLKEREKALDLSRSFIVQAPAGSGKTELLIQRYLRALGSVQYPEQILCMTFTRKAAGEMRERVILALKGALSEKPPEDPHLLTSWNLARKVLEHDCTMGWHLMEYPGRLKIQTIDSLCAWITAHMPLVSRLGGNIQPEEYSGNAYREAARRLLAQIEDNTPAGNYLRIILKHLDTNKTRFLEKVQFLMEKRDQWLIPFFSKLEVSPENRKSFEEPFGDILNDELRQIDTLMEQGLKQQLIPLAAYAADNLNLENPGEPHPLTALSEFPASNIDCIAQWRALANLLLTNKGEPRKKLDINCGFPPGKGEAAEKKQQLLDLIEEVKQYPLLCRSLAEVQEFPDPQFTDEEWAVLQATLNVLAPINEKLRQVFREQEVTDFTEISLSAIKALGEYDPDGNLLPTELMEYLDYRFQHILVDEYQDTSFKQLELLSRLTAGWTLIEGQTLFIVGDPMQSIYRFRDAEVGLFLETKDRLQDLRLERLTLQTNFRAQQGLVDWTNECFDTLFPEQDNPDLGEISFTPSQAFKPKSNIDPVQVHPVETDIQADEALEIVDTIQNIQNENPGQSIAILVRAKTHLEEIIRELRLRQIPYRGEDIDPLSNRWEILDLISLLRALTNPLDRVAWLAVLRAPWLGIPLQDIYTLCNGGPGRSIPSLIKDPEILEGISKESASRIRNFNSIVNPAMEFYPNGNLRDILEGVWIRLGGPACIPKSSFPDIELFLEELDRVLDTTGLSGLRNLEERLNTIFASPVSMEANLHLMTMHKAKGLEFDFVIIPQLGRKPRQDEKRLVFWLPHKQNLLLAPVEEIGAQPSGLYRFVKSINRKKEVAESMRLLYVSATRAKQQLHLFGHAKSQKKGLSPEAGSLLELLWPYIANHWSAQEANNVSDPEPSEVIRYPNILNRLPEGFCTPKGGPSLPTGKLIFSKKPDEAVYEWAGFRARCMGTVLHRCLQTLAERHINSLESLDLGHWRTRVNTALLGIGLSGKDLSWAVEQCLHSLQATLEDETGRWILTPHEESHNEYSLTFQIKGTIETRILDRTFVDAGIRWIIDYKTGLHEGGDLELFLKNEGERYRPQLEGYEAALMQMGEARPIRRAIYHPYYQRFLTV